MQIRVGEVAVVAVLAVVVVLDVLERRRYAVIGDVQLDSAGIGDGNQDVDFHRVRCTVDDRQLAPSRRGGDDDKVLVFVDNANFPHFPAAHIDRDIGADVEHIGVCRVLRYGTFPTPNLPVQSGHFPIRKNIVTLTVAQHDMGQAQRGFSRKGGGNQFPPQIGDDGIVVHIVLFDNNAVARRQDRSRQVIVHRFPSPSFAFTV